MANSIASSVTEGSSSDDEGEFFLDDSDIIDEIVLDDEGHSLSP